MNFLYVLKTKLPQDHRNKKNTLILHFSWKLQVINNRTPYECFKSQKHIKTIVATERAIDRVLRVCCNKKSIFKGILWKQMCT